MKWLVTLAVLAALAGHPGSAAADDPSATSDARAKVLFDEGKTLFAEGQYGKACEKLDASFKLSRLSSTRGLLAACFEKIGKLASAWVAYRDAAAIAKNQGNAERAQAAEDKAHELEPKIAWLAIDATAVTKLRGAKITIDGVEQPVAALATALPIDAGPHVVEADAVQYKPRRTTIDIQDGEKQKLVLEPLVFDPSEQLAAAHHERVSRRRLVGLGIGATGIATLGVGIAFGITAKLGWNSAQDAGCTSDGECPNTPAKDQLDSAARNANIATVLGAAGLVVTGAGLALYLTAPKSESATRVTPVAGPGTVGLVVGGRF